MGMQGGHASPRGTAHKEHESPGGLKGPGPPPHPSTTPPPGAGGGPEKEASEGTFPESDLRVLKETSSGLGA